MMMNLILSRCLAGIGDGFRMARQWLRFVVLASAALAGLPVAMAAGPVSISFSEATLPAQIWEVKAPTGSQLVVKATPDFYKQSKSITLKYSLWSMGGWQESIVPWPTALTLNATGVASVPLKFTTSTHWGVQACYSWKPPGSKQKQDACTDVVYFEGVDPLKKNAEKLITLFFLPPSYVSAKTPGAVAIKPSGQELRLRAAKDILIRSTTKKFRLFWTPEGAGSLPESETQPPGRVVFGSTGDLKWEEAKVDIDWMGNAWGEIAVPVDFGAHKKKLGWTLKACTEIDWSGEICSGTAMIELVQPPVIKMSDQPKDFKVDTNQPLPPLSPPPSEGGGGGGKSGQTGKSGNLPAGNANIMAPPPVLGAPAAGPPVPAPPAPRGQPSLPAMAPAVAPSPADAARTAPVTGVPGCSPVPGLAGQYACATREAYAGCERLRASAASGVRTCQFGGGDQRRR